MIRTTHVFILLLAAFTTGGCLRKHTAHTIYLAADGSAVWTVAETHVYSDEEDPGARFSEEQAYIGAALLGAHPVGRGLQVIGPDGVVTTTVVRDERPFHVITRARFASIDRAFERLFQEAGISARAALEHTGLRRRLRIILDFTAEVQERDGPALALLEDVDRYRFVLGEGRFVGGGGFDVPDRMTAVLSREAITAIDAAMKARSSIELWLAWE